MRNTLLVFALCLCGAAQAPPAFEVASLKPSPPAQRGGLVDGVPVFRPTPLVQGGPGTSSPGQVTCTACPLSVMVAAAYEMSALQVRSAGNLKLGEFELIAKVPHGSSRHQVNLMLRQLLSERFQMTVHTEKQELPVYVLAIGKQPPTLQESTASSEETPALRLDVSPTGIFTLTGRQRSMKELADTLSTALFRPVVDATELKGNYDFSLAWMANQQMPQPRKSEMPPGMKSVPYNPQAAVDVQLGMKIESRKMPVDILMIDSAKAPESNN